MIENVKVTARKLHYLLKREKIKILQKVPFAFFIITHGTFESPSRLVVSAPFRSDGGHGFESHWRLLSHAPDGEQNSKEN